MHNDTQQNGRNCDAHKNHHMLRLILLSLYTESYAESHYPKFSNAESLYAESSYAESSYAQSLYAESSYA